MCVLLEIEYCKKYLNLDSGINCESVYYITVDEVLSEGDIIFENYGVKIKLGNGDEDIIRGITIDSGKIELVLQILADGTVTPVALRDVLYDVLEVII